jgi:hypothetical protein
MKLTGRKTEAMDRRYAIVAKSDLGRRGTKLAAALVFTPPGGPFSTDHGPLSMSVSMRSRRPIFT